MIPNLVILRLSPKQWGWIFTVLNLSILSSVTACYFTKDWIFSDFKVNYFSQSGNFSLKGSNFEGEVLRSSKGLSKDKSYKDLYIHLRNDSSFDLSISEENTRKSLEILFLGLFEAGRFLGNFDTAFIVFQIFWLSFMLIFFCCSNKRVILNLSGICGILACLSFWVGMILWFSYVPGSFQNCSQFPGDGSVAVVCYSLNPVISLVTMIFFSFVLLLFLCVSVRTYKVRLDLLQQTKKQLRFLEGQGNRLREDRKFSVDARFDEVSDIHLDRNGSIQLNHGQKLTGEQLTTYRAICIDERDTASQVVYKEPGVLGKCLKGYQLEDKTLMNQENEVLENDVPAVNGLEVEKNIVAETQGVEEESNKEKRS